MSEPPESSHRVPKLGEFRLGDWSVCQADGTLHAEGRAVRLEPRVMDVLACLAAEPGRVIPKEELLEAVWGGAFVEEGALSQAIHSLRKALGDDARQPRYIQTLPRRGYRLVAPVLPAERTAGNPAAAEPALLPLPAPTRSRRSRWSRLALAAAGLAAAAVVLWLAWDRVLARPEPQGEQPGDAAGSPTNGGGTRIVVLPFDNYGKPEDAYFADGLTEEITKDLASLPSLQVISRTSATALAAAKKPLSEIGRALNVDYVLEGSVLWAEGPEGRPRVRITPQLIRVADDAHVWADSFEREVKDIFEVQAEISRRVISRLGVTLVPDEQRALRTPPTGDLEAYRAYLRGLALKNQPFYSEEHVRRAVAMFERAVKLDPGFAQAWAALAQARTYLVYNSEATPDQLAKTRQALERAAALAPGLLEVRIARAYFTYLGLEDFAAAHEQLAAIVRLHPNNAEALQMLGLVLRRRGRLAEGIEALQRSFSMDPQTVKLVWTIAETFRALRDHEQADRYCSLAISLAPDQPVYWEERTLNRLAWTGEIDEARAILAESPIPGHAGLAPVAFLLDLYERDYDRAFANLSPERLRTLAPQFRSRAATLAAIARERSGDRRGALAAADANHAALESLVARFPRESFYRAYLAVALAQLGRRDEALAQAEQAVRQRSHDAFTGPRMVEIQAMVDVILGRRREAIGRLNRLLAMPYQSPISAADLRLSPIWDPLREEPAFEAMLRDLKD